MATPVFDGLTIVEEAVDAGGWRARVRVERSSRTFTGHFDGEPILPGVASLLVVRHALRQLGFALEALPSVRFRQPVGPGDVLDVSAARPDADGQCRFEMKIGRAVAVSGVARGGRRA
jgi:3-hydroxyacyl-[acyl-carrier-protein] dehydratase